MAEAVRTVGRDIELENRVVAGILQCVHGQADVRESIAELLGCFRDFDEFVKPTVTDFHSNCPRKRMSF